MEETSELLKLAKRVANLNPDAGEIGAGMLAQLVDQARRAVANKDGMSGWVSVSDKLPKVGRQVIVRGARPSGNFWSAIARRQPKRTVHMTFWGKVPDGWQEDENGEATNQEDLWIEQSIELESVGFLEGVTHWMPIPF